MSLWEGKTTIVDLFKSPPADLYRHNCPLRASLSLVEQLENNHGKQFAPSTAQCTPNGLHTVLCSVYVVTVVLV